ncbi:GWxTD domain-containing protein [Gemmatimonadota bacterium]
MFRSGLFKTSLYLLLFTSVTLWARKMPEMPEDFGSEEWVAANYTEAVGYLKYLTDKQEREEFLSVPDNERLEVWQEFWSEFDPVDTTPENEYRDAYFARIRHANESYGTILQPGWLTEMGETYIRLGLPNNLEKFSMRSGGKDIEIWSYWTPREVDLIFFDRSGLGDFRLLNPAEMIDQVFVYGR